MSLCRERFTEFLLTRQAGGVKRKGKSARHSGIQTSRHPGIQASGRATSAVRTTRTRTTGAGAEGGAIAGADNGSGPNKESSS